MVSGGTLSGTDIVLYFTCTTGSDCASATDPKRPTAAPGCSSPATFCVQGEADVDLTTPAAEPHIVVWVDRTAVVTGTTKTERALVRIAGQGDIGLGGNVYVWAGGIEIQGTGGGINFSVDGTMLGDTIDVAGRGTYEVEWDENFAPKILDIALVE
jgi:hypothetical protein